MLTALAFAVVSQVDRVAPLHQPDTAPLVDPMRPVTRIARDGFTLQYYTPVEAETRIQIRADEIPMTAFGRKTAPSWSVVNGAAGKRTMHVLQVKGLQPGKRYYYRVWDPGTKPTSTEKSWGAGDGWRREYAVSTQASAGRKTIIHLPVKVLLMPDVLNVVSAYGERSNPAPEPPKLTPEEIEKIKDEYAISSRFFWVNSGMRLWVDYQFFVDDRWQRWGPEPEGATGLYKGLPANRSYGDKDYTDPGGGIHTFVDTADITTVHGEPIVEERPYSAQVEQAFPRRWNANAKRWEFYNSGGGTFGVDMWPQGFPGRSQFLGGGDTAWLATHEVHHNLESHGEFSLGNREDDRIIFNHYAPRRRVVNGTNVDEQIWTTNGPHGEHWDGMAYWDRTLSDAEWLRLYFGYTETVRDGDGDGFPDNDSRLPLDEKRFGSNPSRASTDGQMRDLDKAMLTRWVPAPLQQSWIKTKLQTVIPNPTKTDNDGDGLPDLLDPYPLSPFTPLIVAHTAEIDGSADEWSGVPLSGQVDTGTGVNLSFKQAHDEAAYYGLLTIKGTWKRVDAIFDGEGFGVYSGVGVLGVQVLNLTGSSAAGPGVGVVDVKVNFNKAPGLKWKASRIGDTTYVEFSLPNRGAGIWYWTRGGHEIGSEINVWDEGNRGFSLGEPYRVYYARMMEPVGQTPMPSHPPTEPTDGTVYKPGDPKLRIEGDWKVVGDALAYQGGDPEGSVTVEGPRAAFFDIVATVEATNDGILGGFAPGQKIGAGVGYVGFVGGYANRVTRLRVAGNELGDEPVAMTPGRHKIQMTRREDGIWLLLDGKPIVWSADPSPQVLLNRLGVLGGYNGNQKLYELRIRTY